MPVYEYSCAECGERFEQYRKVTARSAARCPECGGRGQKVFRPVGIIFKGSGFHCTDYRKPEDTGKTPGDGRSPAAAGETGAKAEQGTAAHQSGAPD